MRRSTPTALEGLEWIYVFNKNEYQLLEDWRVKKSQHYQIRILKQPTQFVKEQQIIYHEDIESIQSIKVRQIKSDGDIFHVDQMEDSPVYPNLEGFTGYRKKIVKFDDLAVNDLIDVRIESILSPGILKEQFFIRELYPSYLNQSYETVFKFPIDKPIRYKTYNYDLKPKVTKQGQTVQFVFNHQSTFNQPALEVYAPSDEEVYGFAQFSSIKNWGDIVDQMDQFIQAALMNDESLEKYALGWAGKTKQPLSKLNNLRNKIFESIQYIPTPTWNCLLKPRPITDVFRSGYASRFELALLFKSLLKHIDIDADIVLLADEFAGDPSRGLPALDRFDDIILRVKVERESFWLDPLLPFIKLGNLPQRYDNASVLILDKDQKNNNIKRIPVQGVHHNSINAIINVDVKPNGDASYKFDVDVGVELSHYLRQRWFENILNSQQQLFDLIESFFGETAVASQKQMEHFNNLEKNIRMMFSLAIPKAYSKQNDTLIINNLWTRLFPNPFLAKERETPVFIPHNSSIKLVIIYQFPDDMRMAEMPESFHMSKSVISATQKMIPQESNVLKMEFEMMISRGVVAIKDYPEIQSLWRNIFKKISKPIIFQ